jgi:hypothetical protein
MVRGKTIRQSDMREKSIERRCDRKDAERCEGGLDQAREEYRAGLRRSRRTNWAKLTAATDSRCLHEVTPLYQSHPADACLEC